MDQFRIDLENILQGGQKNRVNETKQSNNNIYRTQHSYKVVSIAISDKKKARELEFSHTYVSFPSSYVGCFCLNNGDLRSYIEYKRKLNQF